MSEPAGEIVLYRGDDGRAVIQMRAVRGTVWPSRSQMAELYGTTSQNIGQISTNGWWFWSMPDGRRLKDVRDEYLNVAN